MDDYQSPHWSPAPDPAGAWPAQPSGAPPEPSGTSTTPGQPYAAYEPYAQPPTPSYTGEPTNPAWYAQPEYPASSSPPTPAFSQPLGGYAPPPSQPIGGYPPPPPSQPLGSYPPPPPSQPLGGYPGMPAYGPPPGYALGYPPSQPLGGYPPPPGYAQPGYPPPGSGYYGYAPQPMVVVVPPRRADGTAVAIEAILAFFGIYGIGWLIAGETTTGILLLVGSFVWWGVAIVLTAATFGAGLFCIAPLNIVLLILSAVLLANHTRQ